MEPKFKNPFEKTEFLGHYFDHDVYLTSYGDGIETLLARYGDEESHYASMPVFVLRDAIGDGFMSGMDEDGKPWKMPYRKWLFSDRSIPSTSAMILALAVRSLDTLKG